MPPRPTVASMFSAWARRSVRLTPRAAKLQLLQQEAQLFDQRFVVTRGAVYHLAQGAGKVESRTEAEHHQIDELVEDLQSLDPRHAAWLKKARELSQKVHHHLREEEKKFFQVSGRILTTTKKTQLARQYRRDHARMRRELEAQ